MVKREDGLWQQQMTVYENGYKKQKFFYGKTKQEVLKKISEYKETAERGIPFDEAADAWWEEHEPTLSPMTFKSYTPAIDRAKKYFGKTDISTIRPVDIGEYLRYVIKNNDFTQKTIKTHLMVVNMIFKYAILNGDLDYNPARDVTIPKGAKSSTVRDVASDEDIKIIKKSTDTQMGMFAYWLLYTGCRRSELLCLTWEDVDIGNRTIYINKSRYQVNGKVGIKAPKTAAGVRTLPIPDKLLAVMKPGTGLIFPDKDGNIMKERRFELDWNRYRKETGVKCTPHQLRHSYATMLFENNVNVKDAQELLGHADAHMTENTYTHLREQRKAKIREDLFGIDL